MGSGMRDGARRAVALVRRARRRPGRLLRRAWRRVSGGGGVLGAVNVRAPACCKGLCCLESLGVTCTPLACCEGRVPCVASSARPWRPRKTDQHGRTRHAVGATDRIPAPATSLGLGVCCASPPVRFAATVRPGGRRCWSCWVCVRCARHPRAAQLGRRRLARAAGRLRAQPARMLALPPGVDPDRHTCSALAAGPPRTRPARGVAHRLCYGRRPPRPPDPTRRFRVRVRPPRVSAGPPSGLGSAWPVRAVSCCSAVCWPEKWRGRTALPSTVPDRDKRVILTDGVTRANLNVPAPERSSRRVDGSNESVA
jgi:hypothetical protein